MLGLTAFANLLNDTRFAAVPMILETPKSEDMHEDVENLARAAEFDPVARRIFSCGPVLHRAHSASVPLSPATAEAR